MVTAMNSQQFQGGDRNSEGGRGKNLGKSPEKRVGFLEKYGYLYKDI